MIAPEIRIDPKDLKMLESQFQEFPKLISLILARALTKSSRWCTTNVRRRIQNETNMKADVIRKYIKVHSANKNHLQAEINLSGWRIPAAKFKGRRLVKGASYQISKKRGRKTLIHSYDRPIFWGVMESGHEGIFTRTKTRGFYFKSHTAKKAYRLHELLGPSVSTALDLTGSLGIQFKKETGEYLNKRIHHEIKYELEKRKAKK